MAALPSILVLALGTSAPPPPAYIQIEQLEQSRSLGNGRLVELLNSKDRPVALRAALAIGRTKQPAGILPLERRSRDADAAMRAVAVFGLGLIGTNAASSSVLTAFHDTGGAVLASALDATDRLETARVFSEMQERKAARLTIALLRSPAPIIRARAATTLESFAASSQSALSWRALANSYARERDPYVRWHIMWTLYRGYAKTVPENVLARGLKDRDEVVRIEAVRAFGKRGEASALSLLQPLLRDASWRVQEQARESITVLQGGKMTEHLTAIAQGVRTPAPLPDRFAYLPALPRTPVSGKAAAPQPDAIVTQPQSPTSHGVVVHRSGGRTASARAHRHDGGQSLRRTLSRMGTPHGRKLLESREPRLLRQQSMVSHRSRFRRADRRSDRQRKRGRRV